MEPQELQGQLAQQDRQDLMDQTVRAALVVRQATLIMEEQTVLDLVVVRVPPLVLV
jgi:hypothetical protein